MSPIQDSNTTYGDDQSAVADLLGSTGLQAELIVGTSAVEVKVGVSRLAIRKSVTIQPKDNGIFWGYTNAVTTTTGTALFDKQLVTFAASENTQIWLIASGPNKKVSITEST